MNVQPDHFVIAAASLQQGVDYVRSLLNVTVPPGGSHPEMGTHNHLMNLGDTFLEIISIDPEASEVGSPRWFDLDAIDMSQKLCQQPRLVTWVARTRNIEKTFLEAEFPFGSVRNASRGDLKWKIAFPENGTLLENGIIPYLIQWPENVKPWENMSDLGYRFHTLNLFHPEPFYITGILKKMAISDKKINIIKNAFSGISLILKNSEGRQVTISSDNKLPQEHERR